MTQRREIYRVTDDVVLPHVELLGKQADEYVALYSLTSEMEFVQDLLREIQSLGTVETRRDRTRAMGLWVALVTAYGRCFASGWREAYAAREMPRVGRLNRWHLELIRHRNKYAAHLDRDSDPDWEWGRAVAILASPDESRSLVAVDVDGARMALPDASSLAMTERLVEHVLYRLRTRHRLCGEALIEAVTAWSLDDIYRRAASGRALSLNARPTRRAEPPDGTG